MSNASDFVIENGVLTEYVGPGGDVVIPNGVVGIQAGAFRYCTNLHSIILPEGVERISIGESGLCYGKELLYAVFPKSLVNILYNPYYSENDESKTHVANVFRSCNKLQVLFMPKEHYSALFGPCLERGNHSYLLPNFALLLQEENGLRILAFSENRGEDTLKEFVEAGNWQEYDRELINTGLRFKFKSIVRVLGALGRLYDPVDLSEENRAVYIELVKKNAKKLIPIAETIKCPELVRMLFGVGCMDKKTIQAVRKLLAASSVPEIAALADAEMEAIAPVPAKPAGEITQHAAETMRSQKETDGPDDNAGEQHPDTSTPHEQSSADAKLNKQGNMTWDLANQTVTARFQEDFSFQLESADGKIVKSIPKKGADPEKYERAKEGLAQLKKATKERLRATKKILFEEFLSGDCHISGDWRGTYLDDPVMRAAAGKMVWAQGNATFTLTGDKAIDSSGAAYALTDEPIRVAYPLEMEPEDVEAWQRYFLAHGIQQPFSQIWEPVIREEDVSPDRYDCYVLPMSRFVYMSDHGIYFDFDRYGRYRMDDDEPYVFGIRLKDCHLNWEASITPRAFLAEGFNATKFEKFTLGEFTYQTYNRQVNHIVGLLDQWVAEERIKKNDPDVMDFVSGFTLKQLTECIALAEEKKKARVRKLLEAYKEERYPGMEAMEKFIRIW